MTFKSLSIAASAAILSVSLMTGCGGSNSSTTDNNGSSNDNNKVTYSINGTAFDGPLTGVTVTGLHEDGSPLEDCSTKITDTNSTNTGSYSLTCLEKPVFVKVSPTTGGEAKDLGFDGLLGGGDDTTFTDTFYAAVQDGTTNITPLTYLQYMTPDKLPVGTTITGYDAGDIFTVVSAVNVLKASGFEGKDAYGVVALSLVGDENATLRMLTGFKITEAAFSKKASDRGINVDATKVVAAVNNVVAAAISATDTNSRKAVAVVTKAVANTVKTAIDNNTTIPDVSKMTDATAIKALVDAISEAGSNVNLEELSKSNSISTEGVSDSIKDDAKNTVVPVTPDDNIIVPVTPDDNTVVPVTPDDNTVVPVTPDDNTVVPVTSDVTISANQPTFTKSLQTNSTGDYKIVDQMLNIKINNLDLSQNKTDVNLSVCIKNSDGNQSVIFSTEGGDVNNSKITFPAGTQVTVAQKSIPSLSDVIGYESTTNLDKDLVNSDLSFNVKTVLNSLSQNDTKMDNAVKALDNFLANQDTYTMKISSNLLNNDIIGTIKVDGGKKVVENPVVDDNATSNCVDADYPGNTLPVCSTNNDTTTPVEDNNDTTSNCVDADYPGNTLPVCSTNNDTTTPVEDNNDTTTNCVDADYPGNTLPVCSTNNDTTTPVEDNNDTTTNCVDADYPGNTLPVCSASN